MSHLASAELANNTTRLRIRHVTLPSLFCHDIHWLPWLSIILQLLWRVQNTQAASQGDLKSTNLHL